MPRSMMLHQPMHVDEENDNNDDFEVLVENPTLDLDVYANQYTGQSRLDRLVHIAKVCPSLRLEALRMALNYVLPTSNVPMYQNLMVKLQENGLRAPPARLDHNPFWDQNVAADSRNLPIFDRSWVEATRKRAAIKLEKLEADLRNYKSSSIKESIRRAHNDLGDHFLNCGDPANALKCYSRSRDYCTNGKHLLTITHNVSKVSLYLENWSHVLNYLEKAESLPEFKEKSYEPMVTQLKCFGGLAELQLHRYKIAAEKFSVAVFDHCDALELLSPNSIAVYGGLCALATFDRQELQEQIIASATFKQFLELEPQLRDTIQAFYESKYMLCFKLLDDMCATFMLDMYIAPHITLLYLKIRNRALIQYFLPYATVDMRKMAADFNCSVECLECEIVPLIEDGQMLARIDSQRKILHAKSTNQRSETYARVMAMGAEFQRKARMALTYTAMKNNGIQVKGPRKQSSFPKEVPPTIEPTRFAIFKPEP